ncbi:MAG TPA: ABC transporter permease [Pyrinomonadaceae bacterium]|nr:ABC transporter permease [Pyrinomonadaceae bacterium]
MLELVLANLKVRPLRTLISIVGVAIGVVLVVLFTGLAKGMISEMVKRATNWKAEIVFTRAGGMDLTSSTLNVSTAYLDRLENIEGVLSTVAVGRYVSPSTKGRFGLQQVEGVDWKPFAEMNGIRIVEGRAPFADNEVILDRRQLEDEKLELGDPIDLFGNKKYTVVGVFEPPSGSRIKMTLASMQDVLEADEKCTYILVKVVDGVDPELVARRINEELPGNKVHLTSDFIIDAHERVPGLGTFLNILVGLGAFVSTIFVLLSMYTTITERKKEIGVLRSLGASKTFVVRAIESEALAVGILGVLLGLATAFGASIVIGALFGLEFEFTRGWIGVAVLIALMGSLLGALYPALRASGIDPAEVMANE